ncbi:hypothetical protein CAPTEDRAFT_200573 [Capitella teleta]|uniref:Uncharacterized protein n=1 Tax=Capitella teleta TaxID=283909 RepID=R7TEI2_CAPTE|nr:hypothetical protein CAPTEDRAFT_200573 [Capitella teleta]|eukprot:ELT89882.1 hypothetical protein CAPTEDRAFT_200573 [Capitella teleta]
MELTTFFKNGLSSIAKAHEIDIERFRNEQRSSLMEAAGMQRLSVLTANACWANIASEATNGYPSTLQRVDTCISIVINCHMTDHLAKNFTNTIIGLMQFLVAHRRRKGWGYPSDADDMIAIIFIKAKTGLFIGPNTSEFKRSEKKEEVKVHCIKVVPGRAQDQHKPRECRVRQYVMGRLYPSQLQSLKTV